MTSGISLRAVAEFLKSNNRFRSFAEPGRAMSPVLDPSRTSH